MNERNVDAIEVALHGILHWSATRRAAEQLAARGVLAPEAVTDDEATNLPVLETGHGTSDTRSYSEAATHVREALVRIARG